MDLSGHGLGNFRIFFPVAIELVIFKKMLEKFMTISEPDPGFI